MSETAPSMSSGWGKLWGRAFEIYRSKFFTLIGITATVFLPINLLNVLGQVITVPMMTTSNELQSLGPTADPEAFSQLAAQSMALSGISLLTSCIIFLAAILAYPVGYAALARAVCDGYLKKSGGFASAFRQAFRMWPRYELVTLLSYAFGLLVGIWTIIPCIGWFTGPGLFIVLTLIGGLAPIIIIMEQKGVVDTLRRSWDLLRRRFWESAGYFLVNSLVIVLLSLALYGISAIVTRLLGPEIIPGWAVLDVSGRFSIQSALFAVISLPLIVLVIPVYLVSAGVIYFDLRTQTEGFDASAYAPSTVAVVGQISDLAGDAPAAETGNLVTAKEGGYTVLLSIGAVVFYACFYVVILVSNPGYLDLFR